jgi:hypothetical protein
MASILKVNEIQHTGGTSALTMDSNGRLSTSKVVGFSVTKDVSQTITTNSTKINNFITTTNIYGGFNTDGAGGSMLNLSTGIVTIPVTGYYQSNALIRVDNFNGAYHFLDLDKTDSNGTYAGTGVTRLSRSLESATASDYTMLQIHSVNYLQQGDFVALYWANSGDNSVTAHANSYFSMFKVG